MIYIKQMLILFILIYDVSCDLLKMLHVPKYAFVNGKSNLTCYYDLSRAELYSLKWYHNEVEFYRYVPSARRAQINIRHTNKFTTHEVQRSERMVTIELDNLTIQASGEYRCEIIAEHPTFRTETLRKEMIVLNDKLHPPVLINAKEIYGLDDIIEIGCQPITPFRVFPQPAITWLVDGTPVPSSCISKYGYRHGLGYYGSNLVYPAKEAFKGKTRLTVECLLTLGNHKRRINKILRVRRRLISYVNGYYSAGYATRLYNLVILEIILWYFGS